MKVRSVPTPLSPLLANIALDGIEDIKTDIGKHTAVRYADDTVFILKPTGSHAKDTLHESQLLASIKRFLHIRGLEVNQEKTKLTAATNGFDFLGWHFRVQKNGKFRSTPSVENYQTFRKKVKHIINSSNYGAKEKAQKLAPVVRGWRNYHRYCKMDGSRNSLWFMDNRTFKVFLKEKRMNRYEANKLVKKAFPAVSYSENRHVMVKGDKSPFDGDITYWSQRESKLYDGTTAKLLKKQHHICGCCGMKFLPGEEIQLHHKDKHHNNWKHINLVAIHKSCHQYIHMGKSQS